MEKMYTKRENTKKEEGLLSKQGHGKERELSDDDKKKQHMLTFRLRKNVGHA